MKSRSFRIKAKSYTLSAMLDLPLGKKKPGGWPVAILLHGWLGNKHSTRNRRLAAALAGEGIAALRVEFAGHGISGGDIRKSSINTQVSDVAHILAHIQRSRILDSSQVGIVGASIGGTTALQAMATRSRDDFTCGVLISPRSDFGPVKVGEYNFRSRKTGRLVVNRDMLFQGKQINYYDLARLVERPVLVLHGTKDDMIPIEQSRRLVDANRKHFHLVPLEKGTHTLRGPDQQANSDFAIDATVKHLIFHITGNSR